MTSLAGRASLFIAGNEKHNADDLERHTGVSMEHTILNEILFTVDEPALLRTVHAREGSPSAGEISGLLAEAREIARPKALYQIGYVDERGEDYVVINGIQFTSRVLRVNLDTPHRVFAFAATSGQELEAWATGQVDVAHRFWAEAINEACVHVAAAALRQHLIERFELRAISAMNPGSLSDWPISQQRQLFALLGDTTNAIGVRLTASLLMVPTKSVSGILFPTEESFASCQLCPREVCPNRRAPFDPGLYERKYRQAA
jgi:hypothetical protein